MELTDGARRTVRTLVQTALALAAALPLLAGASGTLARLPGIGTALAVAGTLARLMASPAVDGLLPVWLRTTTTHETGEEAQE